MKNRIFPSFLSRFSLQRFFDRDLSEDKSGLKYTRRGIEVVITGLTRNFLKSWLFAPLKKPVKSGVFSGSKIEYFVVLSVSSFQKFLEEMRNHIHGELSEWSKVQHSKCCVPKRNLGFESLTLRQKTQSYQGFAPI